MQVLNTIETNQRGRYNDFYTHYTEFRKLFRFDVRYRCRRLHEVFSELGLTMENRSVLDFGFGGGDLLASFPKSCRVTGVDISPSAVEKAASNTEFGEHRAASFSVIDENDPESIPTGPFDVIVSSHALEHVPDDMEVLRAMRQRLHRDGILALFVPIEEPDYIYFHQRNYSVQSISERVRNSGFDIQFVEGSMYVNGHVWKILTIPSRRRWPIARHLSDGLRLSVLSSFPYPVLRSMDRMLDRLGFGARQALVIAKK